MPIEATNMSTIELMLRSLMPNFDPDDVDSPVGPEERQQLQLAGQQVMEQIGRNFQRVDDERRQAAEDERAAHGVQRDAENQ